jgi:hypothetical protein
MSNARTVVVYGPAGCGKTINAQILRKAFGLSQIIDDYDGRTRIPFNGALVLTNNYTAWHACNGMAECISYDQAMTAAYR